MKKFNLLKLFFTILILSLIVSKAAAQVRNNQVNNQDDFADKQGRPQLLKVLDLTKDQIQQIRQINNERKPIMQESRRRLDEANSALDQAIYTKAADSIIQTRLKDVQAAQAEVIKNRTLSETAISRVLTPAQLTRFRELQQRFNSQKRLNKLAEKQNKNQVKNDNTPPLKNTEQTPNRLKIIQQRRLRRQQRIANQ